jgi:hypothetical protein
MDLDLDLIYEKVKSALFEELQDPEWILLKARAGDMF